MEFIGGYGSSGDDGEQGAADSSTQSQSLLLSKSSLSSSEPRKLDDESTIRSIIRTKDDRMHEDTSQRKKRKKRKKSRGRKSQKKTILLSPGIQAALARGDSLGDSDSDDTGVQRSPRITQHSDGTRDLLSMLPVPSNSASVDAILLKSKKRREAAAAKTARPSVSDATPPPTLQGGTPHDACTLEDVVQETTRSPKVSMKPDKNRHTTDETSDGSDNDGMRSEGQASVDRRIATDHLDGSRALFTLPSRSRLSPSTSAISTKCAAVNSDAPSTTGRSSALADAAVETISAAARHVGQQYRVVPGQEGFESCHEQKGRWMAPSGDQQQIVQQTRAHKGRAVTERQWAPLGTPGGQVAKQSPDFTSHLGRDAYHGGVDVDKNTNASDGARKLDRRRGRDMERELASGNLAALGQQTTVMDLHQGDNEYIPHRTKPVTAAMTQDQKHIEGSVYDPRTGRTMTTTEPTSLQKRKHQINQLAVKASSMERDLLERSGASRLTKAQTHAKYGW